MTGQLPVAPVSCVRVPPDVLPRGEVHPRIFGYPPVKKGAELALVGGRAGLPEALPTSRAIPSSDQNRASQYDGGFECTRVFITTAKHRTHCDANGTSGILE